MLTEEKQIEQTLQFHLAEYQGLQSQVHTQQAIQNQMINYSLAIIVGGVSLFAIGDSTNIAMQQPFLFLIVSLLMSTLSWASLDSSFLANDLEKYIQRVLSPKIQILLGKDNPPEYLVLKWVETRLQPSARLYLKSVIQMGKFAISNVASIIFILVFYSLRSFNSITWSFAERTLFWSAIVISVVPIIGGIMNAIFILEIDNKSKKTLRKNSKGKSV